MFTFDRDVGSQCECLGSPTTVGVGSIPGFLGAIVLGVPDPNAVSFISITSPNGTEVKVTPVPKLGGLRSVEANTVAFNGFEANGTWKIKMLNASGDETQAGSQCSLEFGLIDCGQILPTPDCAGNSNRAREWSTDNFTLVGTTVSPTPTLLQFDVEAGRACCVTPGTNSVNLRLEFNPGSSLGNLAAAGLSPGAIGFNLSGILASFSLNGATGITTQPRLTQSFPGDRADGLWSLNTSTDGATLVINSTVLSNQIGRAHV